MHTDAAQHCLRPRDTGHSGGLLLVILAGLGLSIAAGLMSGQEMTRRPAPAAATKLAGMPKGSQMDRVVQVTAVEGDDLQALVLERRGDAYVPGAASLHIALTPATRFVMGGRTDLRPGAVLQVRGITEDAAGTSVQASQAVILTGYVQVTGGRP